MKKKDLISLLLTIFVIAIYLIPNFATAIEIELDKNKYKRTDTIKFSITHNDLTEEINNVTLFIDDLLICESCSFTEIENYDCEEYGYGYGYGCGVSSFEGKLDYSFENINTGCAKKIIPSS